MADRSAATVAGQGRSGDGRRIVADCGRAYTKSGARARGPDGRRGCFVGRGRTPATGPCGSHTGIVLPVALAPFARPSRPCAKPLACARRSAENRTSTQLGTESAARGRSRIWRYGSKDLPCPATSAGSDVRRLALSARRRGREERWLPCQRVSHVGLAVGQHVALKAALSEEQTGGLQSRRAASRN